MALAKTDAAGGSTLLPEVLAFSSSLALDQQLLEEDLIGSLAHIRMLARCQIVPIEAATAIVKGLISIWNDKVSGTLTLPEEEDVHMSVEVELLSRIGESAKLLHAARSRNDQVATDLRLHVRTKSAALTASMGRLAETLVARAQTLEQVLLPAYTHRQRAQPITAAFWLCSFVTALLRDAEAMLRVAQSADVLPLGSGAISGTSLPIDREFTRTLLRFSRLSVNALDAVSDRDFALEYLFVASRFLLHVGRFATDVIDFSTNEFSFLTLSDDISVGSSMMPQKKNPDVFELLRGKGGRANGNLMALLTTLKGLPQGYNRDLQEDRLPVLETAPAVHQAINILTLAIERVNFNAERAAAGLSEGFTQATDVAEALVKKGVAFRTAYQAAGALVKRCQTAGLTLTAAPLSMAQAVHPAFDEDVLRVLDARRAAAAKESIGGTGTQAVKNQMEWLNREARRVISAATETPTLDSLFTALSSASL